jgi:hypothetical protein
MQILGLSNLVLLLFCTCLADASHLFWSCTMSKFYKLPRVLKDVDEHTILVPPEVGVDGRH